MQSPFSPHATRCSFHFSHICNSGAWGSRPQPCAPAIVYPLFGRRGRLLSLFPLFVASRRSVVARLYRDFLHRAIGIWALVPPSLTHNSTCRQGGTSRRHHSKIATTTLSTACTSRSCSRLQFQSRARSMKALTATSQMSCLSVPANHRAFPSLNGRRHSRHSHHRPCQFRAPTSPPLPRKQKYSPATVPIEYRRSPHHPHLPYHM